MISARTEYSYKIEIPSLFHGYEVISYEGNGCTSVTYKVRKKRTNKIFNAKIISKADMINKNWIDDINKEMTIHNMLDHPNIVRVYEIFEMRNKKKEELIVIIEEYCSKGSLSSCINKNGLKSKFIKKKIEIGLINAVRYLHGIGLAHCDINTSNVLIDKNFNVKLGDFGCCEFCENNDSIFYKNDIWSIGSILYTLSEGKPLTKPNYKDGCLHLRIEDNKLKNIIENSMSLHLQRRPSIEELYTNEYFTFKEANDDDDRIFISEVSNDERKIDSLANSIFNDKYYEYSIKYGSLNDFRQSKTCKTNVKKSKKKNNLRKLESKKKTKSQYFSEKQENA